MKTSDIQIRDPFVYVDRQEKTYYLFGTTDKDCWRGPGQGFDCYKSTDLENWEGPMPAFRPSSDFWGKENFWAPEVHRYNQLFYMFASFIAPKQYRATQILTAQEVTGPYRPLTGGPVTPPGWQCLDGTFHLDQDGNPWIAFCHEWVQIHNGSICTMRLSPDLKQAISRPLLLFNASEAPWVRQAGWPEPGSKYHFPTYVTDGPFLHRTADGTLLMLWFYSPFFSGLPRGGWTTEGKAAKMAETSAGAAVLERLNPICVAQFRADSQQTVKLEEMQGMNSSSNM